MMDQASVGIKRINPPELGAPPAIRRWWRFAARALFLSPARLRLIATAKLSARAILHSRQHRYSKI